MRTSGGGSPRRAATAASAKSGGFGNRRDDFEDRCGNLPRGGGRVFGAARRGVATAEGGDQEREPAVGPLYRGSIATMPRSPASLCSSRPFLRFTPYRHLPLVTGLAEDRTLTVSLSAARSNSTLVRVRVKVRSGRHRSSLRARWILRPRYARCLGWEVELEEAARAWVGR